jgi:DNA-binding IclR family transcriptional regulator
LDYVSNSHPHPVSLRSAASESGLTKATAFRLLSVLVEENMLVFQPEAKVYMLGPRLGLIAARQLFRDPVRTAARPAMQAVWQATGETVTLSLRQGFERIYIDQLESPHPVRFQIELGSRQPLHAGASGRAILAAMPEQELAEYLGSELPALTAATVTDPGILRQLVREAAERGFTVSHAERVAGVISVAAPVLDGSGHPVGALSICAPDNRASVASMEAEGPALARAAHDISVRLGYAAPV